MLGQQHTHARTKNKEKQKRIETEADRLDDEDRNHCALRRMSTPLLVPTRQAPSNTLKRKSDRGCPDQNWPWGSPRPTGREGGGTPRGRTGGGVPPPAGPGRVSVAPKRFCPEASTSPPRTSRCTGDPRG